MSVSVSVRLSRTIDESYEIRIGHGIFTEEARNAIERLQPSKIAVITDSHLNKLYSAAFKVTFGSGARIIEYRAGESRKTIATVLRLFAELQDAGLDRKSLVFAVGGGVTVAATVIGDGDPAEISCSLTQIDADELVTLTLDYDGSAGTAAQQVSITVLGYIGESA